MSDNAPKGITWPKCATEAILLAANLGYDANAIAAVCGQLAGAFYGVSGIPNRWVEQLSLLSEIREIANSLYEAID